MNKIYWCAIIILSVCAKSIQAQHANLLAVAAKGAMQGLVAPFKTITSIVHYVADTVDETVSCVHSRASQAYLTASEGSWARVVFRLGHFCALAYMADRLVLLWNFEEARPYMTVLIASALWSVSPAYSEHAE